MPSISQITSTAAPTAGTLLPLLTSLSNPYSAAIAGGIALMGQIEKIGSGRRAANKFTGSGAPQDILNKQLAVISGSQASAEEKSAATDKAWKDFLTAADKFAAANPKQSQVVKQAIYQTPDLTNTVKGLLGKDPLAEEYTGMAAPGMATGLTRPNPGPSWKSTLLNAGMSAAAPFAISALSGGGAGGVGSTMGGTGPLGGLDRVLTAPNVGGGVFTGGGGGTGSSLLSRLLPQLISGGTSLIGGVIASRAANNAAQVQADAATQAAETMRLAGQDAIGFNREVLQQQQENLQPWLDAGTGALTSIGDMLKDPFKLPTMEEAMQDPGIQFALDRGTKAVEASLRSKGLSSSGKAQKELTEFAQGTASQGYDQVVNRRLTERQANLNPLFSLAGLGQDSTNSLNTALGTAGGRNADLTVNTAANVANQQTNAAAARASGIASSGNIYGSTVGGIGSNILQQQILDQLLRVSSMGRA